MISEDKLDAYKKAMLEALEKTLGIVSSAAKMLGISRQRHYDWIKEDEEYAKAVDEISNITLDFAESQLHKKIKDGSDTAIIFFLKTKGKKRGYIERQEIESKVETNITFDYDKLTDDELRTIRNIQRKLAVSK
jgi:hypothetical protein